MHEFVAISKGPGRYSSHANINPVSGFAIAPARRIPHYDFNMHTHMSYRHGSVRTK